MINIWNTNKINELITNNSFNEIKTPFRNKNFLHRKPNINFEYSEEELNEIKKCSNDIIYFANNYCKILTPNGINQIVLRDYQEKILFSFIDNRFDIIYSSRQSGINTMLAIYLLHYTLFNTDKTSVLISPNLMSSINLLDSIKLIYEQLPFFMKCGIKRNDKRELKLDNQCRILVLNIKNCNGFTIDDLVLHDFSYIYNKDQIEFYQNNMISILANNNSKIKITGNKNELNFFYDIYQNAKEGLNNFKAHTINWTDINGRDEYWKQEQIKNIGLNNFNLNYELF